MNKTLPVFAQSVTAESWTAYPEPFKSRMGDFSRRPLGDAFGLTQFGANLETLQPGAESALRHWHTLQDEFVYMIAGELTLITDDGEIPLTPGMCVGFRAGEKNAHHIVNRSDSEGQFLVVGTRNDGDAAFYPDDDLAWSTTEDGYQPVHKDGTPYPSD